MILKCTQKNLFVSADKCCGAVVPHQKISTLSNAEMQTLKCGHQFGSLVLSQVINMRHKRQVFYKCECGTWHGCMKLPVVCRNLKQHYVEISILCDLALPPVSECNNTVVNRNPRLVTICQA